MQSHESHEADVFAAFVQAARLNVDASSVESRSPPEPDVHCILNGLPCYFELGRLLDREHQRQRIEMLKVAPAPVKLDPSGVGLPERDVLKRKLKKAYDTKGEPLELLLYFDAENLVVAGGIPPIDFDYHAQHVMVPLLTPMPSHVRRVWYFERYRNTVLWHWPSAA